MKSLSRSGSLRGNASPVPVASPGREREPFCLGPFRQQKNSSTPTRNRSRANGENVPPDGYHTAATAAYVKANTQTPDISPPPQPKSSRKGRNGGVAPLPGSPALLPRPPSSKPSLTATKSEPPVAQMQDNLGTAKRKLLWDASGALATDNVGVAVTASAGSDSGVKVIVRMRPLNNKEELEQATPTVKKISANTVAFVDQQFRYDGIADEGASQLEVFEMVGLPMVENCLAGFNSSIFAYGQTGSGKTHTMMGVATDPDSGSPPSEDRGLTPRVFEMLFSRMQQDEKLYIGKGLRYQCRCSFLEIYNEQITDLLEPSQKNLQIREDIKTGVYVDSLSEEFVSSVDDVTRLLLKACTSLSFSAEPFEVLSSMRIELSPSSLRWAGPSMLAEVVFHVRKGLTNRRTGATIMNSESSRSHSVFTCVIESRFKNLAEGVNSIRSSRMNLVDLAGSERQKQTGAAGERLKEAGNINKSLSQLGNVINILAEVAQTGKQRHVPYRDSRLTFLLQESLGGNAKLAMICALSLASRPPAKKQIPVKTKESFKRHLSETLSTLRFAQRAKAVQNKAVVNEETANDVGLLREQIRQLKDELMRMKSNGTEDARAGGYSNGWNARRSYNLLRLSLSHPMTLPAVDLEDTDLEMDIVENDNELETEVLRSVLAGRNTTKDGFAGLPVTVEKDWRLEDTSKDMGEFEMSETGVKDSSVSIAHLGMSTISADVEMPDGPVKADSNPDSGPESALNTDDDTVNVGFEAFDSPELAKTREMMKIPELMIPKALHSPPLSISPRMNGTSKRGLSNSPLAPRPDSIVIDFRPANSMCAEIFHSTQERLYDGTSQSLQLEDGGLRQLNVRASMSAARPTEKLAACLQRGLQILDSQQRSSLASVRMSTAGLRFSSQGRDFQLPRFFDKIDRGVQTSPPVLLTTSTSPLCPSVPQPAEEGISSCKQVLAHTDDSLPTESCPESRPPLYLFRDLAEGHPDLTATYIDCRGNLIEEPESGNLQLSRGEESLRVVVEECKKRSGSYPGNFVQLVVDDHPHLSSSNFVQDPGRGDLQLSPPIQLSRSLVDELEHRSVGDIPSSTYHTPTSISSKNCDSSEWQLVALDAPRSSSVTTTSPPQLKLAQAVEALLTGAIRRERVAEVAMSNQAAEIEQLNRLVRQYKHERECNAILHQTREDKIARLESLVDNIIPSDAYLSEEFSALLLEYKMLLDKFDNHPEVTQSSLEQQRLADELNQYRNFFDFGERDILLEEVKQLRNQLQNLLEHSGTQSTPGRQRRLSFGRMSLQTSKFTEVAIESPNPSYLAALFAIPQGVSQKSSSDLSMVAAEAANAKRDVRTEAVGYTNQWWENEKREMKQDWEERERDWMVVLEELRAEVESYKRQAERRKHEFECEKRCSEEMQEALQMAMTGHARLLEQYAELQEKHIGLLAKHRKIKEGAADVKQMAKRAGVSSVESRWLDAQALQIVALRVGNEEERQTSKDEIEGLRAQLRDTADAVQAAGELLVRLKEAEESIIIALDAAAMAEQDAHSLRRDLEKVRIKHATEVATLQQRLLESRLQKTAVCPMCVMAERVKFQFTEGDTETADAALAAQIRSMALNEEQEWTDLQWENVAEGQSKQGISISTGELEE